MNTSREHLHLEVLRRPLESAVGDSFDKRNGGHWRGLDDLEIATCGRVSWFNDERFHGELDDLTPTELEDSYYRHQSQPDAA